MAFLLATLPFIFRCSRRPHFVRWAIAWLVPIGYSAFSLPTPMAAILQWKRSIRPFLSF